MNTKPHPPTGLRKLGSTAAAGLLPIMAIGWILSTSGCSYSPYVRDVLSPYDEMKCQCVLAMKARSSARSLWKSKYAHCYGRLGSARDIRQGFIDGYVAKATGQKTTCVPIVPPKRYCGIGRKLEANCWFQGYPLGVAAAESSGACEWCTMTINPELSAGMAQKTCNPGCIPCSATACGCGNPQCDGSCGIPGAAPAIVHLPQAFEHAEDAMVQEPINIPEPVTEDLPGPMPVADPVANQESSDEEAPEVLVPINTDDSDQAPPSPSDVIERAIDDVSFEATTIRPTVTPAIDVQETSAAAQSPSIIHEALMPEVENAAPVVGEPVEMPNIQVGFDLYDEGWLFGEVDIARALLENDAPSVWSAE